MSRNSPGSIEVFYSYSQRDEALRNELEKHLGVLKRLLLIRNWYHRDIQIGTDWMQAVNVHLDSAHVILLLISSDFMDSDYCYSVEMQRALKRHKQGKARVIPILLRPVDLEGTPIASLRALPTGGKPITSWSNRDAAFTDVSKGIRMVIQELKAASARNDQDLTSDSVSHQDLQDFETYPSAIPNSVPKLFLIHADADSAIALKVAQRLQEDGLDVTIDVKDVQLGESFVGFMVKSMSESDYCITLWSSNVKLESFIGEEIIAAFARAVKERRAFWLIACLDSSPIPALFQPRICVHLYPEIEQGIGKLVATVKRDRNVQLWNLKPVVPGPSIRSIGENKIEVYVCSGVFDRTVIWSVAPSTRGDELLFEVINLLGVPKILSYQNRIGVSFEYRLRGPQGTLEPDKRVIDQGVSHQSVLWLEVLVSVFAAVNPINEISEGKQVYRTGSPEQQRVGRYKQKQALQYAASILSESLRSVGVRIGTALKSEELEARLSTK